MLVQLLIAAISPALELSVPLVFYIGMDKICCVHRTMHRRVSRLAAGIDTKADQLSQSIGISVVHDNSGKGCKGTR